MLQCSKIVQISVLNRNTETFYAAIISRKFLRFSVELAFLL